MADLIISQGSGLFSAKHIAEMCSNDNDGFCCGYFSRSPALESEVAIISPFHTFVYLLKWHYLLLYKLVL